MNETAIGFKEWLVVCNALMAGRQSMILRKGGIAEGRAGFSFQHDAFFLFPTHFPQQADLVTEDWSRPDLDLGAEREKEADASRIVRIECFGKLETNVVLRDWAQVEALQSEHIWKPEVIRERFDYEGEQCLSMAFVRVYRLNEPWEFPFHRSYGGCRSWVTLPDSAPSMDQMTAVLSDEQYAVRRTKLAPLIEGEGGKIGS